MSTEAGKGLTPQSGRNSEENGHSGYAMPEDMKEALHKLIGDRLMKMSRQVREPGADTGEEVGLDVGWERMPSAAREFHARSAQNAADQQDAKDCDPVATDD